MKCNHEQFQCNANVFRLHDEDNNDIKSYSADIKIHCVQCGVPFEFIGLDQGLSPKQPMVSIDGTEARMPLRPSNLPREKNDNYN